MTKGDLFQEIYQWIKEYINIILYSKASEEKITDLLL